jgi:hypothetical protein
MSGQSIYYPRAASPSTQTAQSELWAGSIFGGLVWQRCAAIKPLASDGGRIVHQEIAWSASGIIRISDLCGGCSPRSASTGRLSAGTLSPTASGATVVTEETLVVGATTLPAQIAWAATQSAIAVVALSVAQHAATSAAQQSESQS